MNIGDVAKATGLPTKTIRYYEDIGLVCPPRKSNGYRAFRAKDLHKLAFLNRARSLGFSIDNCRTLLSLYDDRSRASADVKAIAQVHLCDIEYKIAHLESMRSTLDELVKRCNGDDRPDCPILEDLGRAKQEAAL